MQKIPDRDPTQTVHLYWVSTRVGMDPGRLGMMLNEKIPLPLGVAERVRDGDHALIVVALADSGT